MHYSSHGCFYLTHSVYGVINISLYAKRRQRLHHNCYNKITSVCKGHRCQCLLLSNRVLYVCLSSLFLSRGYFSTDVKRIILILDQYTALRNVQCLMRQGELRQTDRASAFGVDVAKKYVPYT